MGLLGIQVQLKFIFIIHQTGMVTVILTELAFITESNFGAVVQLCRNADAGLKTQAVKRPAVNRIGRTIA